MTPEDWTTTTYKPSIVCSDGNDGVTLFTCGHEKRSLHCVEQNISVLLWYPRHGEVLHLLTLTTTRLKSFEVSLGIQVQGRSWRKTRCLWHNPTFASHRFYYLPLQGRHHPIGHKEDLQFCQRMQEMMTLPKKNGLLQESQMKTLNTGRLSYLIWMPVAGSTSSPWHITITNWH